MRGFSVLLILFLMPALLGAVFVVLISKSFIFGYSHIQSQCRHQSLKAQKILAEGLNSILNLNPKASQLRLQEKQLSLALVAAVGNAPLQIAIKLKLFKNRQAQILLRMQMERIKYQSEFSARMQLQALHFETTHRAIAHLVSPLKFQTPSLSLHLYQNPTLALAPDFLPLPAFEDVQSLRVVWNASLLPLFEFIMPRRFQFAGFCQTTLTKKEKLWEATLNEGK